MSETGRSRLVRTAVAIGAIGALGALAARRRRGHKEG